MDIVEIYDKLKDDNGFYIRRYTAVLPLVVGLKVITFRSIAHAQ